MALVQILALTPHYIAAAISFKSASMLVLDAPDTRYISHMDTNADQDRWEMQEEEVKLNTR